MKTLIVAPSYGLSLFVGLSVWTWLPVRILWVVLQEVRGRERERGPQAELLISLVKVQGYRWVTKPPLITNHFCHESRLERKAASLNQTKKSDGVCTFLNQRCLRLGRPAYFPLYLISIFASRVYLKLFFVDVAAFCPRSDVCAN